MEDYMKVTSIAIWDKTKQAWRVHTEYVASNFHPDFPLVKEHYIAAGGESVLPYAVANTLGVICDLAEDEWMEEIS